MPVNYGGFLGGYINTDEALTKLEGERLQNANMVQANELNKLKIQSMLEDNAAARRASIEAAAVMRGGGTDIGNVALTPEALAKAETGDSPATISDIKQSTITDPKAIGFPSLSEQLLADAKKLEALGGVYAKSPKQAKLAEEYIKAADSAKAKAIDAQKEERQQELQKWTDMYNYLNGVVDQQTLNDTIKAASVRYKDVPMLVEKMGLEKGLDGQYRWDGSTNPAKVKALGEMAKTAKDRIEEQDKIARRAQEDKKIEETARHNRANEEHQRKEEQLQREGLTIRKNEYELKRIEREDKQQADRNERVGGVLARELDKNPIYKNFDTVDMTLRYAQQTKAVLDDPTKGYKALSNTDILALTKQYQNLQNDFRARTGTKFEAAEMEKLNGLWQKADKFIASLGRGTPVANELVVRDMVNTMEQIADNYNLETAISEFRAVEKAVSRGADPSVVIKKADYGRLRQQGRIGQSEDGKYLVFGAKGERQVKIPIKVEAEGK